MDTNSVPRPDLDKAVIGVVGMGYVGLPLAVAFGRKFPTIGFDIKPQRIAELRDGMDRTREVDPEELTNSPRLSFSSELQDLAACNTYVVAVPTPVDRHNRPDLSPLENATRTVGQVLARGNVVVYESTVYPGATEEVCVPILERESGLECNRDFEVGYSPERINPGDREHRLETIVKITSGSTPGAADYIDALYRRIITAGTHRTQTIREAEAAKVIENTQRDVNIALINELAILFNRLGIETGNVLAAAGSKWNFLPFKPGLVGGHCIGVDPYYLTHKAKEVGYLPEVILSGRRINDEVGTYVAGRVVKLLTRNKIHVVGSRILILGLSFKENCPDIRNTRVTDMVREFRGYNANVDIFDPWVDGEEAREIYGLELIPRLGKRRYDAIVLAVAHQQFQELSAERILALCKTRHVVYDIKHVLPRAVVTERL
ncbi:MAG: nucleotide sugar dehydrogenase [Gammaproteobacteria bacterium]|jgi:UDP-N-acetyl-D-galactosamine dehydrogenase